MSDRGDRSLEELAAQTVDLDGDPVDQGDLAVAEDRFASHKDPIGLPEAGQYIAGSSAAHDDLAPTDSVQPGDCPPQRQDLADTPPTLDLEVGVDTTPWRGHRACRLGLRAFVVGVGRQRRTLRALNQRQAVFAHQESVPLFKGGVDHAHPVTQHRVLGRQGHQDETAVDYLNGQVPRGHRQAVDDEIAARVPAHDEAGSNDRVARQGATLE